MKKKKKHGCLITVLVVVGIFVLVGAFGSSDKDSNTSADATKNSAEGKGSTNKKDQAKANDNSEDNAQKTPDVESWDDGMYKVGTDLLAGEYVLISNISGYFQVSTDSTGSLDSIVANDNFTTNSIISVSDGQYLTLKGCTAYKIGEEPALDTSKEGMFKVGKDIPAGEYKIHADSDGYIEVSSDSSHNMTSIVSNENFTGDTYITVSDGQYLKLVRATIVQ